MSRSRGSAPARRAHSRNSKAASLIIIAAIVVAAWTIYPVLKLQYEHQRELSTLEAELASLKERNGELRQEVDELKTPEGVEQIARETLGLVKPGEQAYVVTGGTAEETTVTAEPDGSGSVWQGVLDTLFGFN
jgi:cell division protein FtsL